MKDRNPSARRNLPTAFIASLFFLAMPLSASGQLIRTIESNYSASSATLSHDGKYVAILTRGPDGNATERYAAVREVKTDKEVFVCRNGGAPPAILVFSPAAPLLATVTSSKRVLIWDIEKKMLYDSMEDAVYSISFTVDGKFLAILTTKDSAHIYNVHDRKIVATLKWEPRRDSYYTGITLSPDGKCLAVARTQTEKVVRQVGGDLFVFDVEKKSLRKRIDNGVIQFGPRFSPDGSLLATTDFKRAVYLWRTRDFELEKVIEAELSFIGTHVFMPNANILALAGTGQRVTFWDVAKNRETMIFDNVRGHLNAIAVSGDGKTLATGQANVIKLWDLSKVRDKGR